jgi:hypothetical protein
MWVDLVKTEYLEEGLPIETQIVIEVDESSSILDCIGDQMGL